ncbi:uracil-DNA glycosylase [Fuscovulum ytuae]|uniref:Type-4 uracil-DNA glycosylase n=1 Tax=Fuscovulum ytuae TaxID=3042299 RepID=A0ABY8Q6F9_9RHOB|nr:uracil-DNA glycosylase [Fuscovulum sp. YMD61]WGV15782.1 uracil-DNA glycosylase [Fuscovulum sp. YMD61]
MGIDLDIASPEGWQAALAALRWQLEMGVDEAIGDAPVNAYDLPDKVVKATVPAPSARVERVADVPYVPQASAAERAAVAADAAVAEAAARAAGAGSLEALREALAGYEHCELKKGARNLVFADGRAGARVLILGEAPGRDEDLEGRPFVGAAGQLLDRMFGAIGLSRESPDLERALYITNVMPWRPPGNREPVPEEIAMMRPFVARHVDLAAPEIIVVMGNTPCSALLGAKGILRLRGTWAEALGRPVMPMVHPAYLLRNPVAKREAWADLLEIQAKLRGR